MDARKSAIILFQPEKSLFRQIWYKNSKLFTWTEIWYITLSLSQKEWHLS